MNLPRFELPKWARLLVHADSMIAVILFLVMLVLTVFSNGNWNPWAFAWLMGGFGVASLVLRGRDQGIASRTRDRGRWWRTLGKYALAVAVAAAVMLWSSRVHAMSEPVAQSAKTEQVSPDVAQFSRSQLLSPKVTEVRTFAYCRPKIIEYEGIRYTAYRPLPTDRWTICVGATYLTIGGKRVTVREGMTATPAQCNEQLDDHMRIYRTAFHNSLTEEARANFLTTPRDCAFTSLFLNIGQGAGASSTAIKRLNAGWIEGACDAATWFKKHGGFVLEGLVIRRGKERGDCMMGVAVTS